FLLAIFFASPAVQAMDGEENKRTPKQHTRKAKGKRDYDYWCRYKYAKPDEAYIKLTESANRGYAPAIIDDALLCLEEGTQLFGSKYAGDQEARRRINQLSEQVPATAKLLLGFMRLKRATQACDIDEGLTLIREASEEGSCCAMLALGQLYEDGIQIQGWDHKLHRY